MHPVLQYILCCLFAGAIGVLSTGAVFALWWLLSRRTSVRLEVVFSICGLIGWAGMFVGKSIDSRV